MARRRINVASLDEVGRGELLDVLASELDQILVRSFPPGQGFEHSVTNEPWSHSVSRGALWGLEASLNFNDSRNWVEVRIDGNFPWVRRLTAPLDRLFARLDEVPGIARGFILKLLMPLLLIPLFLALPLIAAHRLATLLLWKDPRAAILQLEVRWPQIQASIQQPLLLVRTQPTWLVYLLSTAAFTGAAWGGFWLAGQSEIVGTWKPLVLGLAFFLAFGSFVLLIALVLTLLGFEVKA